MKKTIAILLVMTIALAGVFAAETSTSVYVTTEVTGKNLIKITSADDSFTTFDELDGLDPVASVAIDEAGIATSLGNLSYFSNSTSAGFSVEITAGKMASISGVSTSLIGYTVNVGTLSHDATVLGTERSSALTLVNAAATIASKGSLPMTVTINSSEYNNAAAAPDYRGLITFYYTAD